MNREQVNNFVREAVAAQAAVSRAREERLNETISQLEKSVKESGRRSMAAFARARDTAQQLGEALDRIAQLEMIVLPFEGKGEPVSGDTEHVSDADYTLPPSGSERGILRDEPPEDFELTLEPLDTGPEERQRTAHEATKRLGTDRGTREPPVLTNRA